MKISREMTISEVLQTSPNAAEVFFRHGMQCLGCAIASGETVAEAAQVHGVQVEDLIKELEEASSAEAAS